MSHITTLLTIENAFQLDADGQVWKAAHRIIITCGLDSIRGNCDPKALPELCERFLNDLEASFNWQELPDVIPNVNEFPDRVHESIRTRRWPFIMDVRNWLSHRGE